MPSPRSIDISRDLLEVTHLLMRGFAARMRRSEQRLEPAQIGILARLKCGECSLTELAEHQAVRLPTVSRSVNLLVNRGWVESFTPPENRRRRILRLTEEGERVLALMRGEAERDVARELGPLAPAERSKVAEGLKLLIRALGESTHERRSNAREANSTHERGSSTREAKR